MSKFDGYTPGYFMYFLVDTTQDFLFLDLFCRL